MNIRSKFGFVPNVSATAAPEDYVPRGLKKIPHTQIFP